MMPEIALPGQRQNRRNDQAQIHRVALRQDYYTTSRGQDYSLRLSDHLGKVEGECGRWRGRGRTFHASAFALEFEEFSQAHSGSMPDFPSLTEQIDFENVCDAIPNPGTRSNLEGLGLFVVLWVHGTPL